MGFLTQYWDQVRDNGMESFALGFSITGILSCDLKFPVVLSSMQSHGLLIGGII